MKRRAESGFTLVETLAAFTILSLVLIQLFGGLSLSVRGDLRASFEETAVRSARSLLGRLGHDLALAEGRTEGRTEDGLTWSMIITSRPSSDDRARPAFWVELTVRDVSHALALTTLKIAPRTSERP